MGKGFSVKMEIPWETNKNEFNYGNGNRKEAT